MKKVKITIGPKAPKLSQQLKGLLPPPVLVPLDEMHEGLVLLYLAGCVTDRQFEKIARKLMGLLVEMTGEKGASE